MGLFTHRSHLANIPKAEQLNGADIISRFVNVLFINFIFFRLCANHLNTVSSEVGLRRTNGTNIPHNNGR